VLKRLARGLPLGFSNESSMFLDYSVGWWLKQTKKHKAVNPRKLGDPERDVGGELR